jgi:hypothetical protein
LQQRFGVSLVSPRVRLSLTAGREKRLSPLGIQFIEHTGGKLGQIFLAGEVVHATLHLLRFALHSIKLRIEHIPLGPLGITGLAREAGDPAAKAAEKHSQQEERDRLAATARAH